MALLAAGVLGRKARVRASTGATIERSDTPARTCGGAMTRSGDDVASRPREGLDEALLASLGLPADATAADVRDTRDRLARYLEDAPPELRAWAAQQAAAAEDACARTTGQGEGPSAREDAATLEDVIGDDADTNPFARRRRTPVEGVSAAPSPAPRAPAPSGPRPDARSSRPITLLLLVLVMVGVVVGVYLMGDAPGQGTAASPTSVALDEARVAVLEDRVAADPADVDAMRELGQLYYAVGDFATAATWQERILALDPDDVDAHLALGVAAFNAGDLAGAEEHWLRVVDLDPEDAAVHYNLGFLYMSLDPPEIERVRAEWTRVVELAPDSELAATASAHLARLDDLAAPTP